MQHVCLWKTENLKIKFKFQSKQWMKMFSCLQLQFDQLLRCEPLCPCHRNAVHDHAMYYAARQLGNFCVSSAAYESVSHVLSSQNIRPTRFHVHHGQPIALVSIRLNCMLSTKGKTRNGNYPKFEMKRSQVNIPES